MGHFINDAGTSFKAAGNEGHGFPRLHPAVQEDVFQNLPLNVSNCDNDCHEICPLLPWGRRRIMDKYWEGKVIVIPATSFVSRALQEEGDAVDEESSNKYFSP